MQDESNYTIVNLGKGNDNDKKSQRSQRMDGKEEFRDILDRMKRNQSDFGNSYPL